MTTEPRGSVFLGFDYGARRIGLAVGHTLTGQARPLPHIPNAAEPDWSAVGRAVREWGPDGLVVGLPIDEEGHLPTIAEHAKAFAGQLQERFKLPVHLCDERLSSRAADAVLRDARSSGQLTRRLRKGDRDGVAAQLILEQWFGQHSRGETHA